MIKVDLITGFLGSGKTTFLKKYARYLLDKGMSIGIIENDYGAVNVDMMLLQELQGENCDLQMVTSAGDCDCHKRRFKTKLIAMGMCGYDRVIVEPSGVFDADEFFDVLREEPLDRWYELGSVISIVDAEPQELDEYSQYVLGSEAASAGKLVLSRTQLVSEDSISDTIKRVESAVKSIGCQRSFDGEVLTKDWSSLSGEDYEAIMNCGWKNSSYVKRHDVYKAFMSLYYLDTHLSPQELTDRARRILGDNSCGKVMRIKGFAKSENGWLELNATAKSTSLCEIQNGQEIIIVIGRELDDDNIRGYLCY